MTSLTRMHGCVAMARPPARRPLKKKQQLHAMIRRILDMHPYLEERHVRQLWDLANMLDAARLEEELAATRQKKS